VLLAAPLTGGSVEFIVTLLSKNSHNTSNEGVLLPGQIIIIWEKGQECEYLFRRSVGMHKQLVL